MADQVIERIVSSWEVSHASLAERIAAGTQPEIAQVGTSVTELVIANVFYIGTTATLYALMSRREKGFGDWLKPIIAAYNAICVVLAGYVVYGIAVFKWNNPDDLKFVCNDGERTGPIGERLGWVFWVFYAQKFWEFLDTFFFILRKSFRQVTFLHVYHHMSITVVVGLILPHQFSGDVYLPIFLNALVHVFMYTHYLVTVLGYKSWWSHWLTSMQLIQFLIIALQSYIAWSLGTSCGTPDWTKALLVGYMGTMLLLFGQFFINKYIKGGSKAGADKKKAAGEKPKAA